VEAAAVAQVAAEAVEGEAAVVEAVGVAAAEVGAKHDSCNG